MHKRIITYNQYLIEADELNDHNSLHFRFKVECKNSKNKQPEEIETMEVNSKSIEWVPVGNQKSSLKTQVKVVHDDILLIKLGPGQSIEAEIVAVKGIGKTHAKWSPVCTAYYRLVPDVIFKTNITDEKAEELVKLCPKNVFDIEDIGKSGQKKAVAAKARDCTTCRECIKHKDFKDKIELIKLKDNYECKLIFLRYLVHIESVGIYSPVDLFQRSINILKDKCEKWNNILIEKVDK